VDNSRLFVRALALILIPFLAVEIVLTPFKQTLAKHIDLWMHKILPGNYRVIWACTGIDEVLLLWMAILATPAPRKTKIVGGTVATILFEIYNVLRMWVVTAHPDPVLHDVLFRWGGFLLVLLLFLAYVKYYKIRTRLVEHGRRKGYA
jgi:exosortase/archaeosortase family protein